MTPLLAAVLCLFIVGTSLLSGIFGMAGGLILVGALLLFMPVPEAMMLHGITQMSSNGWRALVWWRYVRLRVVGAYALGSLIAFVAWSLIRYVPDKATALILLGVTPFLVRLVPSSMQPNPQNWFQGVLYGTCCMMLILVTGVAGPMLDSFFLGGNLDRRQIVATKGMCQIFGHALKMVYFGAVIDEVASLDPVVAAMAVVAAMIGTVLARQVLEAMSDQQYRKWTYGLVTAIGTYYIAYGTYLMIKPELVS